MIPSTMSRTASASMTIEFFSLNLMLVMRVKQHRMNANVFVITAVNGQNPIAMPWRTFPLPKGKLNNGNLVVIIV